MSAITPTDETAERPTTASISPFTDWVPPEERPPTEAEQRAARERTLQRGNETEIDWKKAPPEQRQRYKCLDNHNRDCVWQYRDEINIPERTDNQHKRHSFLAIANALELTPLQRQKALQRLFRLNLPLFGMRTDVVSFCLCGLVVNQDAEQRYGVEKKPYNPARNPENNPPAFASVESELIKAPGRTTKEYIQKVWGKLDQGTPPTQSEQTWKPFVEAHSEVESFPSYAPDWTLPEPSPPI